ncbi:MAG: hypothetical protein JW818_21295 [Pirellulales bacterium]|nr:hypothetical protein [Pirellulales bacterium]
MVTLSTNAQKKSTSSQALVGAAVLFLVPGFIRWSLWFIPWDTNDLILISGSVFFLVLAVWARWSPLWPAVIGMVAYGIYFAKQYHDGIPICPRWQWIFWILNATIAAVLLVGLLSGVRATRQLPTSTDDS